MFYGFIDVVEDSFVVGVFVIEWDDVFAGGAFDYLGEAERSGS